MEQKKLHKNTTRTAQSHRSMTDRLLLLTLTLLLAMLTPSAMYAYNCQVQVGNGTSGQNIAPINLYYNYSYTQQIYTAAQINGDCSLPGDIESISFYYAGSVEKTVPIKVFMKTTEKTSFSSNSDWETVTEDDIVFDGDLEIPSTAGWVTITLNAPFAYDGESNLLIAIDKGYYDSYTNQSWRYTTVTNNQVIQYRSDGTDPDPYSPTTASGTSNNLPNILFNMTIAHPAPSTLTLDEVVINTATISWTAPQTTNTITGYAYEYTDGETIETGTTTGTTANLTGLTGATDYLFQVKAIYSDGESCWSEALDFTTMEACMTPENLSITNVTAHTADLNWTEGYGDGQWVLQYKLSTEEEYTNSVNVALSDLPYTLTGLTAESTYNIQIAPVCDDTKTITGSFTTTITCPAPNGLDATLTPGDGTVTTLSWTEPGGATEWVLEYGTDAEFTDATSVTVNETPSANLTSLTPEATYYARVKAVCGGEDGESQWSNTVTFTPTNAYTLTVNDGTTTNSYVPVYGMWVDSYTKCQFIIPASELEAMQYGNISKMTFYSSSQDKTWGAAEFDVLLTEVDYTTFDGTTLVDWESMDQVYHGSVSVSDYKMEIVFDNGYQYMGGNLLVGFHQTVKGTYSGISWYGVETGNNVAIGGYESAAKALGLQNFLPKTTFAFEPGEAPTCDRPVGLAVVGDPEAHSVVLEWTETGGASAWQLCLNGDEDNLIDVDENPYTLTGIDADTDFTVKVRASCSDTDHSNWSSGISFHTPETCPKPTNLVVTYNGGNTAEVSWDSESTDFNIDVNGTVTAITENPYTLTSLELATTYIVKVQANCGGGEVSAWVTADPFTTGLCMPEDMCEITFTLTDSYGDGWNDAYIDVVDVETGTSLGHMSNQNLSKASGVETSGEKASGAKAGGAKAAETETYSLAVCNGREIQFVWHSGGYDSECSYVVTGINGEIFSGSGTMSGPVNHTVSCTLDPCATPTGLSVSEVSAATANLSWNGNNDAYNLRYRHPVADPTATTATIILTAGDVWGDGSGYQMLLDADATAYGTIIPEIGGNGYISTDGTIGGSTGDVSSSVYDEFEYKVPENADGSLNTENIVINNSISIEIPAGTYDWCITNPTSGDKMWIAASNGNVGGRYNDFVFKAGLTYEFTISTYGSGDGVDVTVTPMSDWTLVENVTNPYTLTGLTPNTTIYEWQVQGVCSECDGGVTEWSASSSFITGPAIELANDDSEMEAGNKNTAIIAANAGNPVNVQLADRTLWKDGYWNTLCLPFDMTEEQVTAQLAPDELKELDTTTPNEGHVTGVEGSTLYLNFKDATTISAGVPYIIKWDGDGTDNIVNPVFTGVTIPDTYTDADAIESALNSAATFGEDMFKGTFSSVSYNTETKSILFLGDENTLYWPAPNADNSTVTIGAFRAYFQVNDGTKIRAFRLNFGENGGEATGILSMDNGQLRMENDSWYSVDGRKLLNAPKRKGVYIHNGTKVTIK